MQIDVVREPSPDEVRVLLREYEASLGFTLEFQSFEEELAQLPGDYAPPHGALFLARVGGEPAGCVALRRFGPATCELKRLYVRPGRRGLGLGRLLTEAAIAVARELGYQRMRLDTTPGMETAQALYRSLGFREIERYRPNPVHGASFLELAL
jgi:ribosomal protein S18 acetylase RimI-like enzyme